MNSKTQAIEAGRRFNERLAQIAAKIHNLSPEQQARFLEAINATTASGMLADGTGIRLDVIGMAAVEAM